MCKGKVNFLFDYASFLAEKDFYFYSSDNLCSDFRLIFAILYATFHLIKNETKGRKDLQNHVFVVSCCLIELIY